MSKRVIPLYEAFDQIRTYSDHIYHQLLGVVLNSNRELLLHSQKINKIFHAFGRHLHIFFGFKTFNNSHDFKENILVLNKFFIVLMISLYLRGYPTCSTRKKIFLLICIYFLTDRYIILKNFQKFLYMEKCYIVSWQMAVMWITWFKNIHLKIYITHKM